MKAFCIVGGGGAHLWSSFPEGCTVGRSAYGLSGLARVIARESKDEVLNSRRQSDFFHKDTTQIIAHLLGPDKGAASRTSGEGDNG